MPPLLERLKERKLFQWAAAYLAGAFVALQALDLLADAWSISAFTIRSWQALSVVGFLVTLVLAWYHGERGRQHVSRTEALILVGLLIGGVVSIVALQRSWVALPAMQLSASGLPEESALLQIAVLPPEHLATQDTSGLDAVVQQLFVFGLSSRRGLAVRDALSLNSELEMADANVSTFEWLRDRGYHYAVRSTIRDDARGQEVSYALMDARNGEVSNPGKFVLVDEAELPAQVQTAVAELVAVLEERTGGLSRKPDLHPWIPERPRNVAAVRAFQAGVAYTYRGLPGGGDHYLRALEIDPEYLAPRIFLVSGLVSRGDTAAAREHVRVLRSFQDRATPFEQAMIEWADATVRGDLEAKARHVQAALTYSPGNNILLFNLAATLYLLGRPAEAADVLRPTVRARWRFSPLYVLWGAISIRAGEVEGLRATLEDALSITPRAEYLYGPLEAVCLFEGDTAAARAYGDLFARHIGAEDATDMTPLYRSLAELGRQRGDPRAAVHLLERAAVTAPGDAAVRLELARALAEAGRTQRAEELYLTAAEAEHRAETPQVEILNLLGEVASALGRSDDAIQHFTRYLEIAPGGAATLTTRQRLRELEAARGRTPVPHP